MQFLTILIQNIPRRVDIQLKSINITGPQYLALLKLIRINKKPYEITGRHENLNRFPKYQLQKEIKKYRKIPVFTRVSAGYLSVTSDKVLRRWWWGTQWKWNSPKWSFFLDRQLLHKTCCSSFIKLSCDTEPVIWTFNRNWTHENFSKNFLTILTSSKVPIVSQIVSIWHKAPGKGH